MIRQLALPNADTDIVIKRLSNLRFGSAYLALLSRLMSLSFRALQTLHFLLD